MKTAVPPATRLSRRARLGVSLVLWLVVLIAIALAWKFTPLAEVTKPEQLAERLAAVRELPAAPLLFIAAFVIGGVFVVPVVALIVVVALLFPPLVATAISFVGAMVSAALFYGVGFRFGSGLASALGPVIPRVQAALAERGIPAMVAIRMLPVAPFTIVNLAAGSIRVRFRDYMVGTALGMLPGIVALSFFGGQVRKLWEDPSPYRLFLAFAGLVAWIALSLILQRWSNRVRKTSLSQQP
jgi:phospholipase D1/2